jgi:hypothetical protein
VSGHVIVFHCMVTVLEKVAELRVKHPEMVQSNIARMSNHAASLKIQRDVGNRSVRICSYVAPAAWGARGTVADFCVCSFGCAVSAN